MKVKALKKARKIDKPTKLVKKGSAKKTLKKKAEPVTETDISSDEEEQALIEGEAPLDPGTDSDESDVEETDMTSTKHKLDLEKLKESDPDFFKFMQSEDADLLDFAESDVEDEDDQLEEEATEESVETTRIPKARKDGSGRLLFDGDLFSYLEDILDPEDEKAPILSPEDVRLAVDAFMACVARVGADIESPKYIINEQQVFEATVRLCFQRLGLVFRSYLKHDIDSKTDSHKGKLFKKYSSRMKQYLHGVLLFLNEVQTPTVIISTLRAVHQIIDLFAAFPKITRHLIKTLVRIWTRKTLDCRVMAYVCMNQLASKYPEHFTHLFKASYLGFVSNSRTVTAETWPLLQFMHRTFAELTILCPDVAYPYAFVYIRQTAIHLRNALISKKRQDMVHAVYNWQLIQCLYMWTRVISKAHTVNGAESLCELAYPLVQIIIGVSKLFPSPRFVPLRFHCVSLLIQMQASCTTYIPTISLACEIFDELEPILRRKPKISKVATKVDLESNLKVTTQQTEDPVWRNTACEHLFRLILQASHSMSSQPAFADLVYPSIYRIRAFVKNSKSSDYSRLFKGLISKLEEHSVFITKTMSTKSVDLKDETNVRILRSTLNQIDSPLRLYYRQWEKVWKMKLDAFLKGEKPSVVPKKTSKEQKLATVKCISVEESSKTEEVMKPQKKKKRMIAPAASHADASVPDQVNALGSWSDED